MSLPGLIPGFGGDFDPGFPAAPSARGGETPNRGSMRAAQPVSPSSGCRFLELEIE